MKIIYCRSVYKTHKNTITAVLSNFFRGRTVNPFAALNRYCNASLAYLHEYRHAK